MMPEWDAARVDGVVAQLGLEPAPHDAVLVIACRRPRVLWASAAANTAFGTADPARLTEDLFAATETARAFASRISRVQARQPFRLERIAIPGLDVPVVAACHAVEDSDEPLCVMHAKGTAPRAPAVEASPRHDTPPADRAPHQPRQGTDRRRFFWEVDEAGVVTRIDPGARSVLGSLVPPPGASLADVLQPFAPDAASAIAAAARDRQSVGVRHLDWPSAKGDAPLSVELGCTPLRGTAGGLRGFFAVQGGPDSEEAGSERVSAVMAEEQPERSENDAPVADVPPIPVEEETAPTLEAPAMPEVIAAVPSGNVVHFPVMRIGPVPANFVPALRQAPARPDAPSPEPVSLPEPQWSEAPSQPPAFDEAAFDNLSADERDAFEHIRKVLGTRPFPPKAPPPQTPPSRTVATDTHPLIGSFVESIEDGAQAWEGAPAAVPDDRRNIDTTAGEIVDRLTDGHIRFDENGTVVFAGVKAAKLLDREPEQLLGSPIAGLLFEGQLPSWQALAASASGPDGSAQAPSPLRLRNRDGSPVPVLARLARQDGDTLCALTVDRPAEPPANDSHEEARREAERTSALKSEFLAKVSHEIRTPLNAILGFAEVIRDERLGPVGNPRYLEYLQDIHASGTHVMSLVNDLLDLSRIEAGRMDLRLEAVDANAVVQSCVNTLQTQANHERVIVRLSLTQRLPATLADARSLRQILLNLLSNAIKFNEPGGQVIVSTAPAGPETVAIRIRDTGVGMTESEIETAMEPFRQLSTVNRTGSGLGLPLTKALVEANCARMTIKSTPGEGTLVEVSFPLVEPDSLSLPAE